MRFFILSILAIATLTPAAHAQEFEPAQFNEPYKDVTGEVRNYRNFRALQVDQTPQNPDYETWQNQQEIPPRANAFPAPPISQQQLREAINVNELLKQSAPSALEDMYSKRIVQKLEQFGYDLFGVPSETTRAALNNTPTTPSCAVQDDFILGSGDELEVTFTGQRVDRNTYKVDSNGLLMIPDLPPIPAAGRSIGQIRISIQAAARNLHNTEAYVSLSSVRQIGALVIGHVKRPGRKNLTVFHTVLDALMESGGIEKTGSLRQIKLIRDGRATMIDLYSLLMYGQSAVDLRLHDGDRIIIPAIGPTVAIAGEVKRPGIFEILPTRRGMLSEPEKNSEKLTLNEMLELGGGALAPGKNRFLKLSISNEGEEDISEISDAFAPGFSDGSILMISKGTEKRAGTVELQGNTRRPGLHALSQNKTLAALLSSEAVLGPETYPLTGIIERYDTQQLTTTLIDFPLRLVLKGEFDRELEDGDIVHLFSNVQIRNLEALEPSPITPAAYGSNDQDESKDLIDDHIMISFLKERSAFIRGAIRNPGAYPVAEGITLDSVIAVAGGLALEADTRNIEVTSSNFKSGQGKNRQHLNLADTNPQDVIIEAGASIRINQKFEKISDKSVLIMGEVENPGRYDLLPGDKVSDLLNRAGGLSEMAYPYGTIFSRQSERMAEESRYRSQSRAIKQSIASALEADDEKVNASKISEARALAAELENAQGIGRITIESDPGVLQTKPELDLLLEPGDRLYIPRRNLTVRVHGEVLSPASLQFREGKNPLDYINEAGGFSFHADKDRSFVLYPDGSAQPLQVSSWNYKPTFIPPGSTIVVPRDPKPYDFIESAKDVSQILSNLAVTTIFIDDVISDD